MKYMSETPQVAHLQLSDKLMSLAGSPRWSATPSLVTGRGQALLQRLWKVQLPEGCPVGEGACLLQSMQDLFRWHSGVHQPHYA